MCDTKMIYNDASIIYNRTPKASRSAGIRAPQVILSEAKGSLSRQGSWTPSKDRMTPVVILSEAKGSLSRQGSWTPSKDRMTSADILSEAKGW